MTVNFILLDVGWQTQTILTVTFMVHTQFVEWPFSDTQLETKVVPGPFLYETIKSHETNKCLEEQRVWSGLFKQAIRIVATSPYKKVQKTVKYKWKCIKQSFSIIYQRSHTIFVDWGKPEVFRGKMSLENFKGISCISYLISNTS